MTIEITLPIKCSTVKRITEIKHYLTDILACFMALLFFPGTVLVFLASFILCVLNIGGIISPLVSLISLIMIFPGYCIYIIAKPLKIKCIQDEVDE